RSRRRDAQRRHHDDGARALLGRARDRDHERADQHRLPCHGQRAHQHAVDDDARLRRRADPRDHRQWRRPDPSEVIRRAARGCRLVACDPRRMRTRVLVGAIGGLLVTAALASGQFGFARGPFREYPPIAYDGRFTFVRLKYTTAPGGYWYGGW